MRSTAKKWLAGIATAAVSYHLLIGWGSDEAEAVAADGGEVASEAGVPLDPDRHAYFGDLHQHTANSYDAYLLVGTRTTPDEAFKFARGDTISYLGKPVHRDVPLDFLAVTDHSENIGVFNQLDDPDSELSGTELGKLARDGGISNFTKLLRQLGDKAFLGKNAAKVAASAWQRSVEAANANYQPGKFTTFIGYEWTSMPDNQNLHRNVIFRGSRAPAPFTRFNSENPADLWTWLGKIRAEGYDALAIPHNANASNGLMFDWNTLDGRPIDEAYAQLRATNEPIAEVSQSKGSSETHPLLSPNDEFAGFEIWNKLLVGDKDSKKPGSYWRDALGRGLVLGDKLGANPFKYGAAGAGDLHNGLSVSSENDIVGGTVNLGGGRKTKQEVANILGSASGVPGFATPFTVSSSAALTGVWAGANTREEIYKAFRRKETFATSGTRIKVRFFGGWNFPSTLLSQKDWLKSAYAGGVPMGGDLPLAARKAPSFVVQAVKDPKSGNLDRVQIVKVWLEGGVQKERVFDVAWSGKRRLDPKSGKVQPVGNTVDLKTGRYTNAIGATTLSTVWKDPAFKADQAAVYYVRVLEIPTPRWTTLRAIEYGLPLPKGTPATLQERAWSSPIWYTPQRHARAAS